MPISFRSGIEPQSNSADNLGAASAVASTGLAGSTAGASGFAASADKLVVAVLLVLALATALSSASLFEHAVNIKVKAIIAIFIFILKLSLSF